MSAKAKQQPEETPREIFSENEAQRLVDELHDQGNEETLTYVFARLMKHAAAGRAGLVEDALDLLLLAQYRRSDACMEAAKGYAQACKQGIQAAAAESPAVNSNAFQPLADRLADLIDDPQMPEAARDVLEDAAIEFININGHSARGLVRRSFAYACSQALAESND